MNCKSNQSNVVSCIFRNIIFLRNLIYLIKAALRTDKMCTLTFFVGIRFIRILRLKYAKF